jgi:probable HAF family extracellular repeat protein
MILGSATDRELRFVLQKQPRYPSLKICSADFSAKPLISLMATLDSAQVGLSSAHGINNSHQVVGWSDTRNGEQRAFLHGASSGVPLQPGDALPSLGGTASAAYSINEQADVVGDSATEGNSKEHAFLYRKGALRDLGTLGGDTSYAITTALS